MNIKEFETTKRLFAKGTICEERKLMIQANKLNFAGHEKELHDQLITLNLLELADYLVWIPMKRFTNIEVLGNGGYSTVYSGTVEWPTGFAASTIHTIRRETGRIRKKYAMKEIDLNMVTELVLTTHISYHVFPSIATHVTMPVIGLSYHPVTKAFLMVMDCAESNLEHQQVDFETWHDIFFAALDLARGIMVVHDLGVIHHDLHPGNIVMKGKYRQLRIIDVGLGSTIDRLHNSKGVYGRLAYLPSEVIEGHEYTQASDIYCLGTLLWQLITGVPPRGIAMSKQRFREEMIPDMPKDLQKMFSGCWHPDPKKRPSARSIFSRLSTTGYIQCDMFADVRGDQVKSTLSNKAKAFIATRRQQHAAECSSNAIMERPSAGKDYDMRSQFHTYDSLRKISDMARVDYTKFHDYGSLTRIYSLVEAELKHEQSKSDKLAVPIEKTSTTRESFISQRALSWLKQKPTPARVRY